MTASGSVVGSPAVVTETRSSWSVVDFILIWLGGFLGAGALLLLGELTGDDDWLIVLGLAGQYLGNIAVFWYLTRRKDGAAVGLSIETRDLAYIAVGLFLQLLIALLFRPLVDLLFPDGRSPQQIAEAMADADASTLLKMSFFTAAVVLAPLTEELMFRGVLLKAIARRGRAFAITTTAVAFAAVHVIGLDLERPLASAAVVLPPVLILGAILAWVTFRSDRLGPAIFIHSGWNLLAAIVLLIPTELLESVG